MTTSPVRLHPHLPNLAGAALARLGARLFRGPNGCDLLAALPTSRAAVQVLVPRGQGWPLLATRRGGTFKAWPHGAPCSPTRWACAGGVALHLREVASASGPVVATPAPAGASGEGWLHLRLTDLDWSAVARLDPAAGRGLSVVAAERVLGVSPGAYGRGLRRGQSIAAARRACPGLRVLPPASGAALRLEIGAWLEAAYPGTVRVRGGWSLPWAVAGRPAGELLSEGASLLRRLWEGWSVRGRVAASASARAARAVAGLVEVGWVAVVEPGAEPAFDARGRSSAWTEGESRASWRGPALVDLESALGLAGGLAARLGARGRDGSVTVALHGSGRTARVELPVPSWAGRSGVASLAEARLRPPLASFGEVDAVSVSFRLAAYTRGGAGARRAARG